jgi:phage gp16-like protein
MNASIKPDRRTRDLAAIHACAKKLDMDRETYEALLLRIANVRSAASLDADGRARVLDELHRLGAPNPKTRGRPKNLGNEPMLQKIGALLVELKAPWSYADAIARQMFHVERVAWLRKPEQLRAVIAALNVQLRKKGDSE